MPERVKEKKRRRKKTRRAGRGAEKRVHARRARPSEPGELSETHSSTDSEFNRMEETCGVVEAVNSQLAFPKSKALTAAARQEVICYRRAVIDILRCLGGDPPGVSKHQRVAVYVPIGLARVYHDASPISTVRRESAFAHNTARRELITKGRSLGLLAFRGDTHHPPLRSLKGCGGFSRSPCLQRRGCGPGIGLVTPRPRLDSKLGRSTDCRLSWLMFGGCAFRFPVSH
ncbi:hypothetical protein LY76DRAFT_281569 [Colletotrichum caudatum]|nr:hypothetical protein LY76DRAFT_281569 [Colletotrichum caudatum]